MKYQYKHSNYGLTPKQSLTIKALAEKAFYDENLLNRHFTIHLKDTKAENNPQLFLSHMMRNTRKWLQRRRLSHSFIWVLENGKYKGVHAHILLYIPAGFQTDYKRAMKRWLEIYDISDIKVRMIQYPDYGDLHPLNGIHGVVRYLCKGTKLASGHINDDFIQSLDLKDQGEIIGRRWGTNIKR
jgi:hypothetical protein